jgi:vacuolar-type H+-ATPase subunit E/Vma4
MADKEDTPTPKRDSIAWAKERAAQAQARLEAEAKASKKPAKKSAVVRKDDRQMMLELWPEATRGVPNAILRGSLFGISTERRIYKKRTLVAAVEGYEIRFKGETFNQTDLDVLEAMLHLAMSHPLGKKVEFSVHSLLQELGRKTSGEQHEQFKEQIARLIGGVVEITDLKAEMTFMGTLVQKAYRDEKSGRYVVIFDKDMLALYESGYTLIDWQQRMALGKNNIAKWLHGFYASHAAPFPYKVETLLKLCGSVATPKEFKRNLKKSLTELVTAGAIQSWSIDHADLVHINRTPAPAQVRHLSRKKRAD